MEMRKLGGAYCGKDSTKTLMPSLAKYKEQFDPREVIGQFFEEKVSKLFNLEWADVKSLGHVPDYVSKDRSFFVEVKSSAYDNGGVINMGQLRRFDREIMVRRFYAFPYHPINRGQAHLFLTREELRNALSLRSLYLFPFSIVKAHFEKSWKIRNPKHDTYIQLRESRARKIFEKDEEAWKRLGLDPSQYRMAKPHEKIHIVTRNGYLEQQLLDSLNRENI
ncbi:MAG: hypothetical protein NTY68_00645 [Candidatus Micrarchaeota archaeon]|nr:hypothetical protein [Candidatus Micrarchaeota archaeon]